MKSKRFILLCIIIFILSLSCISASEDTNETLSISNIDTPDTGIVSISNDDTIINSYNENQTLTQTENNEIITAGNNIWYVNASQSGQEGRSPIDAFHTLNQAIEASSDGDTINIASGTYSGNQSNVDLIINKQLNLVKYGDGDVIFDGENNYRIFTVTATTFNITGLTFKNGKADRGGAIFFKNALSNSNINATYINNYATDSGGANYFFDPISNSNITGLFINNRATYGGANFFEYTVKNSVISGTFTNNIATDGGANDFNREVSNSNIKGTYTNNNATNGGANYFNTVTNTNITGTYTNNNATNGGANYFQDNAKNLKISGRYINNTGNSIIYFNSPTITNASISDAIFINECYNEIDASRTGLVANNNWFGNNETNYNTRPNVGTNVGMDTWLFLNITQYTNFVIFRLNSFNQTSNKTSEYDTAKIGEIEFTLTGNNVSLYSYYSPSYKAPTSSILLNQKLYYERAGGNHGRITGQWDSVKQTTYLIKDFDTLQDLIENAAENTVINLERNYLYRGFDTTTDGILINKNIAINGNGFTIDADKKTRIFRVTAGSLNITNVTLKNGKAEKGGAIYFENKISNSNINATFIDGGADYGGACYFTKDVENSNISGTYNNNKLAHSTYVDHHGGANYFGGTLRNSNINGTYTNNEANSYGGANYFNTVTNSNIDGIYINNTAMNRGGANYFNAVTNSNITGTYENNKAKGGDGGANYFINTDSNSNIAGTYNHNTAAVGGANYFEGTLRNSNIAGTYTNNEANLFDGGANYFERFVLNSNISGLYINNTATDRCGGAIGFEIIANSTISGIYINNKAVKGGTFVFYGFVTNTNITGQYINTTTTSYYQTSKCTIYFENQTTNVNINNAIFLNPASVYEISGETAGITASNNWFGSNSTNYKNRPDVNESITMNSWLFLKGEDNGNKVKFYLMSYDRENMDINEYDNTLVGKVNLTIIPTNAEVDKTHASLNEEISYTITNQSLSGITAQIENGKETVKFNGDFDLLQNIINAAEENSIVNLTRNFTYTEFDKITNGVMINKNITINGNGFTIDAKGKTRIFYITAESINITNVTLKNGNAEKGGAIYVENKISNSDINATFINNTAEHSGGANYFADTVTNSIITGTYTNNTAKYNGGANCFSTISNSNVMGTYENNKAKVGDGGANYFLYTFTNSNITGTYNHNTANRGGANYFSGEISDSNITGLFNNNLASNGGANYFEKEVNNSAISGIFANNTATDDGGTNFFNDEVLNSNITGTYTNNTATGGNGGANWFWKVKTSNITGTYTNNTAAHEIIYINTGANVDISNAIFLNNAYNGVDGLINVINNNGVVVNNNWFGNNATNYQSPPDVRNVDMSTWLFLTGTDKQNKVKFFLMSYNRTTDTTDNYDNTLLPIVNLTLIATNTTPEKNHALLNEEIKHISSTNASITGQIENAKYTIHIGKGDFDLLQDLIDEAEENSIINLERNYTYNELDTITTGVLINKNITINGNGFTIDAKGKSRIFNVTARSVNITNVTLQNGKATYGGAIYFTNPISNSNINATFINNTANRSGGVNYFANTVTNSNITGTYNNNTASRGNGGVNYFADTVTNSNIIGTYDNNKAIQIDIYNGMGGANYFGNTVTNTNITGTYNHNIAKWSGGANHFEDSVTDSNINGTYNHNTATKYGGANYFNNEISNSNIIGTYTHNVGEFGGANYFNNTVTDSNITGTYTNNGAPTGGVNYFADTVINTNINGTYTNNTADTGGANYFNNNVTNSNINGTYTNNTAKWHGGANYFKDAIKNSTITGTYNHNKVTVNSGGANHFNIVTNSNITGTYYHNTAIEYGGANYFSRVINSTIIGTYNQNIAAIRGGANTFWTDVTNSNITGTYTNNSASTGGANYFGCSVTNSNINGTYTNNTAKSIIYFDGTTTNVNISNAIFLNNNYDNSIINATNTGVVANNNWFGKNATNYQSKPDVGENIQMDTWLFLNATANHISPETFDILFKLYAYNREISDYDNSKMPIVNLTLTSTNGNVDKRIINLDESVIYTATVRGQGSVTARIENAEDTIVFINTQISANLTVEDVNIDYGENITLNLNYNDTAIGTVNITINGKKYNKTFENIPLNKTITLEDIILPGEYNITVTYSGDDQFVKSSANATLTVNKLKTEMEAVGYDIYFNATDGIMFTIKLPVNATGNLTISNGITLNVSQEGRKEGNYLIIEIKNNAYSAGQYNWTFNYLGDDIYENAIAGTTANILPVETKITANTTSELFVDDIAEITYDLTPEGAVGNVKFESNDTSVVKVNQDGNITAVGEGTALITVTFEGNGNYTSSNTTIIVTVSKIATSINVENATVNMKALENTSSGATLNPPEAGNLTYKSSNESVAIVENGQIKALREGTAIITISFNGTDKYMAAENKTITVTVNLADASVSIDAQSLNLSINENNTIVATTTPEGLNVTFTSSNSSVATVDSNGNVKAIGEGEAIITVSVGDDGVYAFNSTEVQVSVSKVPTKITLENETMDLKVNEIDNSGATLDPDVGNLTYKSSNESVAIVENGQIKALREGTAIITISFNGTDKYAAAENKTITVTVSLNDAKISTDVVDLVLEVGSNETVNISLDPEDLKFTPTSSDPSVATIDENGIVTAHKIGNATITLTVGGDGVYALNSTSFNVTVTQIKTEITANTTSKLFIDNEISH